MIITNDVDDHSVFYSVDLIRSFHFYRGDVGDTDRFNRAQCSLPSSIDFLFIFELFNLLQIVFSVYLEDQDNQSSINISKTV